MLLTGRSRLFIRHRPRGLSVRRDIICSARQPVPAHPVKVCFLGLDQVPLDRQLALGVLRTECMELSHKLLSDPAVRIGKLGTRISAWERTMVDEKHAPN